MPNNDNSSICGVCKQRNSIFDYLRLQDHEKNPAANSSYQFFDARRGRRMYQSPYEAKEFRGENAARVHESNVLDANAALDGLGHRQYAVTAFSQR